MAKVIICCFWERGIGINSLNTTALEMIAWAKALLELLLGLDGESFGSIDEALANAECPKYKK